jgi:hypothetical protein
MASEEYTIRLMKEDDITDALLVFASHGYYECPSAVQIFMKCDPNAFYVAVRSCDRM